jgi:hypothetical protein
LWFRVGGCSVNGIDPWNTRPVPGILKGMLFLDGMHLHDYVIQILPPGLALVMKGHNQTLSMRLLEVSPSGAG